MAEVGLHHDRDIAFGPVGPLQRETKQRLDRCRVAPPLRVASNNAEQEEAVDELDIDYGGDNIEIGFNVTYLIDALANSSAEMVKLELQDSSSSALFTLPDQPGFKYVVMPMRI